MAEKFEEISKLVIAYITDQLTEDQQRSLNAWVEESSANKAWLEQWRDNSWIANELEEYNEPDVKAGVREIMALIKQEESGAKIEPGLKTKSKLSVLWPYFAAAAVIVLLIGAWKFYELYFSKRSTTITITDPNKQPIDSTKGEHIILALEGQRRLIFDELPNGLISSQAGVQVIKKDSVLQFTRVGQDAAALSVIQTISTGKGRRLQVMLSDGTNVWLNAGSSIRFPLAFGSERKIETTGEVYVEVHKDKLHRFLAITPRTKVEALGTKFNINTYGSTEKVVLLEGKIKIKNDKVDTTLSVPGEAALLGNNFKFEITRAEDVEDIKKVTAWRTGAFTFRKDAMTDALREIERWYGIPVRYKDIPPTVISHTSFPRDLPLPTAIHLLHQIDSNLNILNQDSVLIVSYKKGN